MRLSKVLLSAIALSPIPVLAAIGAVPITGQNLFRAEQSMSERWMHQDLSDPDSQLLLYQNVTDEFEVAEIIFYAFAPTGEGNENVSTLDNSPEGLMNGYATGPYIVHPPEAIDPQGPNEGLLEDYRPLPDHGIEDMAWPADKKGRKPGSPRITMKSICGSVVPEAYRVREELPDEDVVFGDCQQQTAYYELVNSYGGNRLEIVVPPNGEVHVDSFIDSYDFDYSNNSGIIAYKVDKVRALYQ